MFLKMEETPRNNFLVTYITPNDSLPADWYPKSEGPRRRSANDAHYLRNFWEREYGIRRDVKRRESEPAEFKFHEFNTSRRNKFYDFILGRFPRWLISLRSKQQAVVDTTLLITLLNPDPTLTARLVGLESSTILKTWLVGNVQAISIQRQGALEFAQDLLTGIWKTLRFLWWAFKEPILLILMLLFSVEIFAIVYTFTNNTFMNTFCEMKPPLVRDWVCSDWDTEWVPRYRAQEVTDINQGFENILDDGNLGFALSLPYYLSNWQSQYRYLRSHLRSAKLPAADEEFSYNKLTESMELSKDTVISSQSTFSHLHGTVNYIVDGTQKLVGSLNETGFLSAIVAQDVPGNSLIATGMQWMESHYLVYLPVGLEPFQETTNTLAQNGIMRMRLFVHATRQRLMDDKMAVLTLQAQLRTLAEIADALDTAAAYATDEEETSRIIRGHRRWYSFLKLIGEPNLNDYVTEQRLQALESMVRIYQGHIDYLSRVDLQLGSALQACDALEECLIEEESLVRRGLRPSDWVIEQPVILEKGAVALGQELKAWDLKKREFNKKVFDQVR